MLECFIYTGDVCFQILGAWSGMIWFGLVWLINECDDYHSTCVNYPVLEEEIFSFEFFNIYAVTAVLLFGHRNSGFNCFPAILYTCIVKNVSNIRLTTQSYRCCEYIVCCSWYGELYHKILFDSSHLVLQRCK